VAHQREMSTSRSANQEPAVVGHRTGPVDTGQFFRRLTYRKHLSSKITKDDILTLTGAPSGTSRTTLLALAV
jgi:hypothetical protein